MASKRIKGITIEIDGDVTGLNKALEGVEKNLRNTGTELKDVNKLLKLDPTNTELLRQKHELLEKAIGETKTKLDALNKAAEGAKESVKNYDAWKEAHDKIQVELEETEKKAESLRKEMAKMEENGQIDTKEYKDLQTELEKTEKDCKDLKKQAKETSEEFGNPISTEQYDALQREIIETEQELKNLQKETGSASASMAEASEKLGKVSEVTGKVGDAFMPVTIALAGVGAAAVKTAADFEESMDQVQALLYQTADSPEELAQAMADLEEKAREMGSQTTYSAAEVADGFQYMGMAGWDAKEMIAGIDGVLYLAESQSMDLAEASDILTDALSAFGDEAEDASRYADVMAAASANANTNVSMLGESFKYVAPVAGAMGYSVEDTALALSLMANSGIKASQGGTALRSMLTNLAKPTTEVEAAMEKLGISLDDGHGNMKSLEEVMKDLRSAFGDLKMPQEEFIAQMENIQTAFENGEMTEEQYTKATENLMKQAYGAEGAMKAEYAATIAGKAGMAGLLAILSPTDEKFEQLSDSIHNSTGTAEEMAEIMRGNLNGQITILMSQLQELAISIGQILLPYISKFVEWLQKIVDWFNNLSDGQKKIIVTIATVIAAIGPLFTIISKVTGVLSTVMGIMSRLGPISGVVSSAMSGLSAVFAALTSPIGLIIAGIVAVAAAFAWAYTHCEAFREAVNGAIEWVKNAIAKLPEIFAGIIEAIANFFSKVYEFFTELPGKIHDAFVEAKEKACEAINEMVTTIVDAITGFVDNCVEKFIKLKDDAVQKVQDMKDKITGFVDDIKTAIVDKFTEIVDKVVNAIENLKNKILGFFTDLGKGAKEKVENMKKEVTNKFEDLRGNAVKKFEDMKSKVVSIFTNLPGSLFGAISNLSTTIINGFRGAANYVSSLSQKAVGWAQDFVSGFQNGIQSKLHSLQSSVAGMAERIRSFLHFSRPDEGPLRDYEKWPKDFVMGYAEGIRKNSKYIKEAVAGISQEMAAVQPAFSAMYEAMTPATNIMAETTVMIGGRKFDAYVTKTSMKGISRSQAESKMVRGHV